MSGVRQVHFGRREEVRATTTRWRREAVQAVTVPGSPTFSAVAVDGSLQLSRRTESFLLTFIWVQILHIPAQRNHNKSTQCNLYYNSLNMRLTKMTEIRAAYYRDTSTQLYVLTVCGGWRQHWWWRWAGLDLWWSLSRSSYWSPPPDLPSPSQAYRAYRGLAPAWPWWGYGSLGCLGTQIGDTELDFSNSTIMLQIS